jgi:hypothetical protein
MKWLERIAEVDGRLFPVYVDADGHRTVGTLGASRGSLPRSGYQAATVKDASLQAMKACDAAEYLEASGWRGVDPTGHQVFELTDNGQRILIPAVVMLLGLVGVLTSVSERILEPGSLDRLAFPAVVGNELDVRFYRQTRLSRATHATGLRARFAWFTCYASGRKFWQSVYEHAVLGRLGLDVGRANIDASSYGRKVHGTVIATRVGVNALTPTEAPLPFAAPYLDNRLDFNERGSSGAENLQRFRASGRPHPCTKRQDDIFPGVNGWAMTDAEWTLVCSELRRAGFTVKTSGKGTIDLALKKFGAGKPWSAMGPRWETVVKVQRHWEQRGKWTLLKRVLAQTRAPA